MRERERKRERESRIDYASRKRWTPTTLHVDVDVCDLCHSVELGRVSDRENRLFQTSFEEFSGSVSRFVSVLDDIKSRVLAGGHK